MLNYSGLGYVIIHIEAHVVSIHNNHMTKLNTKKSTDCHDDFFLGEASISLLLNKVL